MIIILSLPLTYQEDIKKAINYFTLAANQNEAYAQHKLGFLYQQGEYVQPDINKAIYFYSLAVDQNDNHNKSIISISPPLNTIYINFHVNYLLYQSFSYMIVNQTDKINVIEEKLNEEHYLFSPDIEIIYFYDTKLLSIIIK